MAENLIYSINGPVVTVRGKTGFSMMEMVYVGEARLVGEVIRLSEDAATIQVYEETGGLAPGEPGDGIGRLSVVYAPLHSGIGGVGAHHHHLGIAA